MFTTQKGTQGFTLVEALIVSALVVLVFGALLSSLHYSLQLINYSQAKLSAMALANERLEYFRSLPYNDVGTILGIPSGTVPQNSTTTLNNIEFHERVLVEYVDDPADGTDVSDDNGVPADYKRVKLEYTWEVNNVPGSIMLVTNIVPRSIETNSGGGTVKVNVINAALDFLEDADVRLINNTASTAIDVTKQTNASGTALFSGAPATSDYEVVVTANIGGIQYSTDQTYQVTATNTTPTVAPFTVVESGIATLTFQIDALSDLAISANTTVTDGAFVEPFDDLVSVASSSQVTTTGGKLELAMNGSAHYPYGFVYLGPIEPSPLQAWQTMRVAPSVPVDTSYTIRFYTGSSTGPYSIIPDADLPGNSTGFADRLIDISALDTSTYPKIYAQIFIQTTDTALTPTIDEAAVYYRKQHTPYANDTFEVRGTKTIGSDASSLPIYKYEATSTTDAAGAVTISSLEFDQYTVTVPSYDIASACPAHPFDHEAGVNGSLALLFETDRTNTLRVVVTDGASRAVPGASVNLTRTGYNTTLDTDVCGQVFFSGSLTADSDYVLTVTTAGYQTEIVDPVAVTDDTLLGVVLTEI